MATELGVSEATVKTHLYSIYRKLGVANRVGATAWYLQARPTRDRPAARDPDQRTPGRLGLASGVALVVRTAIVSGVSR